MNKKTIYFILVILGVIILFYGRKTNETSSAYLSVLGLVILMFSLYKISTSWVKKDKLDDEKDKSEEEL